MTNCPYQVGVTVRTQTGDRPTRHIITARCQAGARLLLRVDPSVPGTAGLNAWVDAARFTLVPRSEAYL